MEFLINFFKELFLNHSNKNFKLKFPNFEFNSEASFCDGKIFLFSLIFVDEEFFIPYSDTLKEGQDFAQRLANLKIFWKAMSEYYIKNKGNNLLEEFKPDFAAVAQENKSEICKIFLLFLKFLCEFDIQILQETVEKLPISNQQKLMELMSNESMTFNEIDLNSPLKEVSLSIENSLCLPKPLDVSTSVASPASTLPPIGSDLEESMISPLNQRINRNSIVDISSSYTFNSPTYQLDENDVMRIDDFKEKISLLQSELKSVKIQRDSLALEISQKTELLQLMEERNNSINSTSTQIIETLKFEKKSLEEKKREMQILLTENESKISLLTEKVENLRIENGKLTNSINGISLCNENLNKKLLQLENENLNFTTQSQELIDTQRQLRVMTERFQTLNEKLKAFESGLTLSNASQKDIEELKTKLNIESTMVEDLKSKNFNLNKELEEEKNSRLLADQKILELSKMLKSSEDRIYSLENQLNQSSNTAATADKVSGISIIEAQLSQILREKENFELKFTNLLEENSKLNEANQNQSEIIFKLEKELENSNTLYSQSVDSATDTADIYIALESLQTTIKEKEAEIMRLNKNFDSFKSSVKREQKLIMSAWYDIGIQSQRKFSSNVDDRSIKSSSNGSQSVSNQNYLNSPLATRSAMVPSSSVSWLQQQRSKVDSVLLSVDK